jgi:hypothetical protein
VEGIRGVAFGGSSYYRSFPADFAEEYFTEMSGRDIPVDLVIDWETTFFQSLRYDFDFVEAGYRVGYVFSNNV